ncbi:hypothetical protein CA850_16850 [Micromonospora echinospora]|uniref:LPXTG-motif cell wall anchor domain-containing protein n=1 Tax=Micromonospora echinospora TaxID=1877 RepID=A0A1C4WUN3_MICEC|nr:hypothetical protein [Micromonospora echinospora]OZV79738.1 hypothetical protein CA850_16850 [Micromonospora echinospora]SCE99863.1 hypothetical protein GA0070618_2507 [Micromonospora echinospora]
MVGAGTSWPAGGVLVVAAALLLPAPADAAVRASVVSAVRAEPSAGTGVTFEVVPAQPTVAPTQPAPTQPGGALPVTGFGLSRWVALVTLGLALLVVGWWAARRRRPA